MPAPKPVPIVIIMKEFTFLPIPYLFSASATAFASLTIDVLILTSFSKCCSKLKGLTSDQLKLTGQNVFDPESKLGAPIPISEILNFFVNSFTISVKFSI